MTRFNRTWRESKQLTPEGVILREVKYMLRLKGYRVWRNHQSLGSERGISDLMAVKKILPGEFKKILQDKLNGTLIHPDLLFDRLYDILENAGLMCRFVAVECKTEKGKLSEAQALFMQDLQEQGARIIVARKGEDVFE